MVLVVCIIGLAGCSRNALPDNPQSVLFAKESDTSSLRGGIHDDRFAPATSMSTSMCPPSGTAGFIMPGGIGANQKVMSSRMSMRYSPGDRFNIFVPGSPEFTADYAVNADGRVILPYAGEIPAVGLTNTELTDRVERALVKAGLFQSDNFKISIRPVQYAAINVTVAGAVFLPGRFVINNPQQELLRTDRQITKFGDSPVERFVAAALRSAGGVRPDADLANVRLIRGGVSTTLNWRGALIGAPVDDLPLLEGDHIQVGEASCFQSALVRPSQITPPGIRVFMSNLTVPALNNNGANNNKDTWNLPYGVRFLQGLVAANCVGGARASNAGRYGVLISRNPKTLETEVIQRSIEELVLSPDRDTINPFLMPEDSIACYDSAVTDVREVATTLNTILNPGLTYRGSKY